jgi:hypothetical protein
MGFSLLNPDISPHQFLFPEILTLMLLKSFKGLTPLLLSPSRSFGPRQTYALISYGPPKCAFVFRYSRWILCGDKGHEGSITVRFRYSVKIRYIEFHSLCFFSCGHIRSLPEFFVAAGFLISGVTVQTTLHRISSPNRTAFGFPYK